MALNTRSLRIGRSYSVSVGAIERSDPIPPGVYWIDIIHELAPNGVLKPLNFQYWVQANPGRVEVLRLTINDRILEITKDAFSFDFTLINEPGRTWVLFRVHEPVNRWGNDTGLGLPTVAEDGASTTEEDTIRSPELEEDLLDRLADKTDIPTWAWLAAAGGLISAIVGLLIRRRD